MIEDEEEDEEQENITKLKEIQNQVIKKIY